MKYGRSRGPRSDRRSIIIISYVYYVECVCVCVLWTRLRRRRIKRGACDVLAYNYNKKFEREIVCVSARASILYGNPPEVWLLILTSL